MSGPPRCKIKLKKVADTVHTLAAKNFQALGNADASYRIAIQVLAFEPQKMENFPDLGQNSLTFPVFPVPRNPDVALIGKFNFFKMKITVNATHSFFLKLLQTRELK